MKREIIFRGKRVDNKEWVYGYLMPSFGSQVRIFKNGQDAFKFESSINDYLYRGEANQVDPSSIGQFTGMIDRDGAKIYEGDIIKSIFTNPETGKETVDTTEVIWDNGEYRTKDFSPLYVHCDNQLAHTNCEVVGNIHEPKNDPNGS